MRTFAPVVIAVSLVFALGACDAADDVRDTVAGGISEAQEGLDDVRSQAEEVTATAKFCGAALRTLSAVNEEDWDGAVEAGRDLAAAAPDEIEQDTQTVLEGVEQYRAGDRSAVATESFQAAAERVKEFTRNRCDPAS